MLTRLFILSLLLAPPGQALANPQTDRRPQPAPLPPKASRPFVCRTGFASSWSPPNRSSASSGVCWDAEGNLFVAELHGYNREEQFDIEELNKTGELDRVVRRIAANEDAMRRAESEQIGTVKK